MEYLIELLPAIITGLFLFYWQRQQNKRDVKKAEEEKLRREGRKVEYEMVEAAMELSYATAMAWKNGKPNGEVESGLKFYNKAKTDKETYDRELKSKLMD